VCWSEPADLAVGSLVVGIGVVGMTQARNWRDLPLAALPVLLGAHQLIESRIWSRSTGSGDVMRGPAVTAWTLIAFVVLPAVVPLLLLIAERERRRIQYIAAALGLPVAVAMAYSLRSGAHATDHGHYLAYSTSGTPLLPLVLTGYLLATCLPFLTSPEPTMRELGIALVVGAVLATVVNMLAFASIWCAFAAVVSLFVVRRTHHAAQNLRVTAI
jgi:hypothetical protein